MASDLDRMRSLMSTFYGVSTGEEEQVDPTDMDSAAFDARAFLQDQLRRATLPELIATQKRIKKETGSLEGDMKELVYNNYTKFISATETIKDMQDSVDGIEQRVRELRGRMSRMADTSSKLSETLDPTRKAISELHGVKLLIDRLQFLFDLPDRLDVCVERNSFPQAVGYYSDALPVLREHAEVPSVDAIRIAADRRMEEIKRVLRGVLGSFEPPPAAGGTTGAAAAAAAAAAASGDGDDEDEDEDEEFVPMAAEELEEQVERVRRHGGVDAEEAVGLLVRLGEDRPGLRQLLLAAEEARVDGVITKAVQAAQEAWGADRPAGAPSTLQPPQWLEALNRLFLPCIRSTLEEFHKWFLDPEQVLDAAEQSAARAELAAWAKASFGKYFAALRSELCAVDASREAEAKPEVEAAAAGGGAGEDGKEPQAAEEEAKEQDTEATPSALDGLVAALGTLHSELRPMQDRLRAAGLQSAARLLDRAAETVEGVVRSQVLEQFRRCRLACAQALQTLLSDEAVLVASPPTEAGEPAPLRRAAMHVTEQLVRATASCVARCGPLVQCGMDTLPDMARAFPALVGGEVTNHLLWLASACECVVDRSHPSLPRNKGKVVSLDAERRSGPAEAAAFGDVRPSREVEAETMRSRVEVSELDTASFEGLPSQQRERLALVAAAVLSQLAGPGLGAVMESARAAIPAPTAAAPGGLLMGGPELPEATPAARLLGADWQPAARRIRSGALRNLSRFARLVAARVSGLFRLAIASGSRPGGWLLTGEEPSGAGEWAREALRMVIAARRATMDALDEAEGADAAAEEAADAASRSGRSAARGDGGSVRAGSVSAHSAAGSQRRGPTAGAIPAADAMRGLGGGVGSRAPQKPAVDAPGSGARLHEDIQRLFADPAARALAQRSSRLDAVLESADSVCLAVLRLSLTSLLMEVRKCVMARRGYQHMQVNVATIHMVASHLTLDSDASSAGLEAVLDEVLSSSGDRTVAEPTAGEATGVAAGADEAEDEDDDFEDDGHLALEPSVVFALAQQEVARFGFGGAK